MTITTPTPPEVFRLWQEIEKEPGLHFADNSPKDFMEFIKLLADTDVTVFVAKNGNKLLGWIGFNVEQNQFHGIHFLPEFRGTPFPRAAIRSFIDTIGNATGAVLSLYFMEDNPYMWKFVRKLNGVFEDWDGAEVTKDGKQVRMQKVTFGSTSIIKPN